MRRAISFEGRSTRVRVVNVSMKGEEFPIDGEEINLRIAFAAAKVDERLGRAPRRLRLMKDAFCEVQDLEALNGFLASMAHALKKLVDSHPGSANVEYLASHPATDVRIRQLRRWA